MSLTAVLRIARRIGRLALLTAASAAVVLLLLFGSIWARVFITGALVRKVELFLLTAVEIAYALAVVLSLVCALALGVVWLNGRRMRKSLPRVARWLLLCGSLLAGAVLGEITMAAWQHHRLARTPMPVGGLGPEHSSNATGREPRRLEFPDLPARFSDPPGDRSIDIAVLGESSAAGVPFEQWLSMGKIIAWQLEQAIPGRRVGLRVLARSGDTLEGQHNALVKLDRRPELFIIYAGHNEFSSRLYSRRNRHYYLDSDQPGRIESQIDRLERFSWVCRLIREEVNKCLISIPPSRGDERNLVDIPAFTSAEYTALLADFRDRLEAIVNYADKLGSLVVLIIPAGNDADFDPNRSWLPAATPRATREQFGRAVLVARRLEGQDPTAAMAQYRALLAAQPGFAEVHYRLAKLLDQWGKWDEAYEHYIAARDLDGYPQRILTAFQTIYREVAARHHSILVDTQTYFHRIGKHGLLDNGLFQDAMHPSLRGQIAIAQAVLQALEATRAFGWPSRRPAPVIDPVECAGRFGLKRPAWAHVCAWTAGFHAMVRPFRYEGADRAVKSHRYEQAKSRIDSGDSPESQGLPNIGIPPAVPLLHANFAVDGILDARPVYSYESSLRIGRAGRPHGMRGRGNHFSNPP